MLDDLISSYSKFGQSGRNDDDVYDRYSHRWTVILLGVFTIAVSAKQFVGDPIECMLPTETGGVHKSYVENYCWIHYTYSIDEGAALTRDFARGANGSQKTPYYIWIPYIFVAAALCTYLPAWLWHVLGHRATFDIPAVINRLAKADLKDAEDRRKNLVALAQHYEKADRYSRSNVRVTDNLFKRAMSTGMFFAGGGPLTGIYFFIKLCYLFNAMAQFFLMNYILQLDYWSYGFQVLRGLLRGSDWLENKVFFPRIVFCDFTIRYLGDNNPKFTVQCTLPVNLYNERIFAFYWFWLVFLVVATCYGIAIWLARMSYRGRRGFLKMHLRMNLQTDVPQQERRLFNSFADRYLGGDGILFLRLVAKNTNVAIAGELLTIMWARFLERETTMVVVSAQPALETNTDLYLNGGVLKHE